MNDNININNSLNAQKLVPNFTMAEIVDTHDDTPETEITLQMIKGLGQQLSTLNMAYFSKSNRNNIQNAIRRRVYELSNGKYIISPQNEQELMIIMREIYIENSLNYTDEQMIRSEIEKLNNIVIDKSVVMIIRSISGYFQFLADQNTSLKPMEPPVYSSRSGQRGEEIFPKGTQF